VEGSSAAARRAAKKERQARKEMSFINFNLRHPQGGTLRVLSRKGQETVNKGA
jgi:hypothetical protein